MSTTLYQRSVVRLDFRGLYVPLQILGVSIIGFTISRPGMTNLGRSSELFSSIAVVTAFVAAIALRQIQYSDVTSALRITMRWVGIFVFLQVLFDALGPFPGPPNILFGDQGPVLYFRYIAVIGVLAGVAALWRPSFLIPLFLFYVGWRELIGTLSGIPVVDTDYLGLLDVGYFSTLGAFVAIFVTSSWARERLPFLWKALVGHEGGTSTRGLAFGLIWACGVGAHLGSYYHSGRMKMHVGGADPFFWVLHNPTQNSILIGLERGDNPLALWPHLLQMLSDGIAWGQPFLNIFVFGLQLLAPLAAASVSVLAIFCLLFDMFHIGVYLTLGALFFFWIAMNLVIVAAAASLPRNGFTWPMKIVMVLTALFGHHVFYTNFLGWLDAAKLVSPQFFAVTQDDREVAIPSNYFGVYSYTIAQTRMYLPDEHFKLRIGGNNMDIESWDDARSCGVQTLAHQDTGVTLDATEDLVRNVDSMMRRHPVIKNYNLYYFYPHHMLPNPWVFTEFNRLRIDDIVGYKYRVESVCLSLENGHLVRDVRKASDFSINLP
jgi:hypothetical protein